MALHTLIFEMIAGCDFYTAILLVCFLTLLLLQHSLEKMKKRTAAFSEDGVKLYSEEELPALTSYPIIGCKFSLGSHPHKVLAEVARSQFDERIFQVKAGCRKFVVFTNYEDIMHIAKNYPEELFGKPHSFTTGKVSIGAHNDMVDRWKKRRAYTNAGLKQLERQAINDILDEEVGNFVNYLESISGLEENGFHDVRHEVSHSISRVLCKMSYGGCIDSTADSQLKEIVHDLPDYTTSMGSFSVFDTFPFLRFLYRNKYQKFIRFNYSMKIFCRQQREKMLSSSDGGTSLWEFFSEKLSKFGSSKLAAKMPGLKDSLLDGLEDIIRAGTESTSLIIQWLIVYAVKYPHVQEKMYSEIDAMLEKKKKTSPDLDDSEDLSYCRAVLAETHRFCSLNPFLKRQLTGDIVTRDNFVLRKGTSLLFNNWALNFDSSYWSDPDVFLPERFLDADGTFDNTIFSRLLSFGFGKRRCIGIYTGRSLCFLATISIFHRFSLIREDDVDIEPIDGIGLSPKPFKITVERR